MLRMSIIALAAVGAVSTNKLHRRDASEENMRSLMNRRIAACCLGACLMMSVSASAGPLPDRVEQAAQDRIAAGIYQTLVFGVVDGDNSAIVVYGKLDNGEAPDGDTVYEIGSVTKTFTATLLAQAVLSGRMTLDTPVAQLLPDCKIPSRGGKQITLGQLGTHRSGLPRDPFNLRPKDPADRYADYDAAKLKAFLADYELPRDPGASYEDSNLGFGLLGYALAQSARTTYGALVDKEILGPLGMTMSSTVLTDAMRGHLATGHDHTGKVVKDWNLLDALAGTGAIRSTGNDMLRYLKANMGIVQSPLVAAMKLTQQPRSEAGNVRIAGNLRIGLGWLITEKGIVWHAGTLPGYKTFFGFTADGRRGVVILADTPASANDLGFAVLDADSPLASYKAIALPAASLDDYVGTYRLADRLLLKVFRMNDGLFAQVSGQGAVPIIPSAANEFFAKIVGTTVSFTRDPSGAVNGLVLHQNGDRPARKLRASEIPPEPKEIELDAATLGDYIGQYRFSFGVLDVALDSDHLEVRLTGQRVLPIFASGKDKFFYKVVDAQLDFERDAGGKVVAVVLHQGGRDMRATRMATQR
ncbi:MAG TPA: serine hydrolase [Xanthobacteraceae bacterium]|nr:serine hydrolase [Xanthobacteraceae bacterium]